MQVLKSIVVENDPKALSLLLSLISDYCPELNVVSTATNIQDAANQIINNRPDIVFLDIELDDGSGFDVLNQVPDKNFQIIIISGYSQYALNAFKYQVVHYLLKPVCKSDLRIAIDRILHYDKKFENITGKNDNTGITSKSEKKIQISTNKGIDLISHNEIEFLEADGCYTTFYLQNKERIIVSKHLKNYESLLSERNFYRVGRTHIINLDYIKSFNKHSRGTITMRNGLSIIIPRRKKAEFTEYLNSYL